MTISFLLKYSLCLLATNDLQHNKSFSNGAQAYGTQMCLTDSMASSEDEEAHFVFIVETVQIKLGQEETQGTRQSSLSILYRF